MILERVRKKHLTLMEKTLDTLRNVLYGLTHEDATTLRDGENGWTVTEVLGHLRDYDIIFYNRAVQILNEELPQLPAYDHEQLAIERAYNSQNFEAMVNDLCESRARFIDFFQKLPDDQWERAGIHPENGYFTLIDALMQVGHHDVTHLEQITRILTQR